MHSRQQNQNISWNPTTGNQTKVNFDASIRLGVGTGLGAMFRDNAGNHLASACLFITYCYDPFIEEVITFRWDIKTLGHMWFSNTTFETNS
ncbi:hypothetical protein HKD37_03G006649 [Glycine soja]